MSLTSESVAIHVNTPSSSTVSVSKIKQWTGGLPFITIHILLTHSATRAHHYEEPSQPRRFKNMKPRFNVKYGLVDLQGLFISAPVEIVCWDTRDLSQRWRCPSHRLRWFRSFGLVGFLVSDLFGLAWRGWTHSVLPFLIRRRIGLHQWS